MINSNMRANPKTFGKGTLVAAFFVFFLLLNFQNLSLTTLNIGSALKPYHLMSLVFLPMLLWYNRINKLPAILVIWEIVVLGVSALASVFFRLDPLFLNYIFCFYTIMIVTSVGAQMTDLQWLNLCKYASLIMMAMVLIKAILYKDVFIAFFAAPFGHPILPYFYGGGANLEATWIALSVCFFMNTKWFFSCLGFSMGISVLYASRVGIIINLCCLLLLIVNKLNKKKAVRLLFALMIVSALLFLFYSFYSDLYIFQRLGDIGNEAGSIGRLNMWKHVGSTFLANPFGYGAGNSVFAVESYTHSVFAEDNIHNIYLQVLLDFGVIGAVLFIIIIIGIFKREWIQKFKNPFGAYLICYCIAGLIQFRGGEPITWFVAGIYLVTSNKRRSSDLWSRHA